MVLRSILISPIARYFRTRRMFSEASNYAKEKGKQLMMIGDPCSGNYFQFMSDMFPNSKHGDVTIDLYGCQECKKDGH